MILYAGVVIIGTRIYVMNRSPCSFRRWATDCSAADQRFFYPPSPPGSLSSSSNFIHTKRSSRCRWFDTHVYVVHIPVLEGSVKVSSAESLGSRSDAEPPGPASTFWPQMTRTWRAASSTLEKKNYYNNYCVTDDLCHEVLHTQYRTYRGNLRISGLDLTSVPIPRECTERRREAELNKPSILSSASWRSWGKTLLIVAPRSVSLYINK